MAVALVALLGLACSENAVVPTLDPLPTYTPVPSPPTAPTDTPVPTETPKPTVTTIPTATPRPTYTPLPTYTPYPTPTPEPTPTVTHNPTPVPIPTPDPVPTSTPQPVLTPQVLPSGDGSRRSRPFPYQSQFTAGVFDMKIIRVDTDAWPEILAENQFNDPPARGYQFIMWTIGVQNVKGSIDEDESVSDVSLALVGSRGKQYLSFSEENTCGVIPNELYATLYRDGYTEGNVCFAVPINETAFVFLYDTYHTLPNGDDISVEVWFEALPDSDTTNPTHQGSDGGDRTAIVSEGGRAACSAVQNSMDRRVRGEITHAQLLIGLGWAVALVEATDPHLTLAIEAMKDAQTDWEIVDALEVISVICGMKDVFESVPLPPRRMFSSNATAVCESLRPMIVAWKGLSGISDSTINHVADVVREAGQTSPEEDIAQASRTLATGSATGQEFREALQDLVTICGYRTAVPELQE